MFPAATMVNVTSPRFRRGTRRREAVRQLALTSAPVARIRTGASADLTSRSWRGVSNDPGRAVPFALPHPRANA
jgi:hypothetical protein